MTRKKQPPKYNVYVDNKGELVLYDKKNRKQVEELNEKLKEKGYKCKFLYGYFIYKEKGNQQATID